MLSQEISQIKTSNTNTVFSQKIRKSDVLYEDNHFIAINKLAGVLVQGDISGDEALSESLAIYLKDKYNKAGNAFVGVIHRLDRPVSGLVLFAKTSKGLSRMNEIFRERHITKVYQCLVEGRVNSIDGKLESYLRKDGSKNKSFPSKKMKNGYKKAILKYKVIQHLDHYSWLKITPETGRHHQIRVQLAEMGHIIKGDLKYGAKRSNGDASICLHSFSLKFIHPINKEEIEIIAPLNSSEEWARVKF